MPEVLIMEPAFGLQRFAFVRAIEPYRLTAKPRRITTRRGQVVRGPFPSRKVLPGSTNLSYESLVEKSGLLVLEVSRLVDGIQTQPCVLRLQDDLGWVRYTPDVLGCGRNHNFFLEIKGDHWLSVPRTRANILRRQRALRAAGVPGALMAEADLKQVDMDELRLLMRLRPSIQRRRDAIDTHEWDPLDRTEPDADTLRRWRQAQDACDALLQRVMRRDPDDLPAISQ